MNESQIASAVVKFARVACGLRGVRGLTPRRVTGDSGQSGIWQCYVPFGDGLTSCGPNILVTGSGECSRRDPPPSPFTDDA